MTMQRRNDRENEDREPQEGDTDYELSEAHNYSNWEQPKRNWARPFIIGFSIFLLISMLLPLLVPLLE